MGFSFMKTTLEIQGTIIFDPRDLSNKHQKQTSWKRVAMVVLDGGTDLTSYYAWFIFKRYGLKLNKTIRGAHISFVNDHIKDIDGSNQQEKQQLWESVKAKYHKKRISVVINLDARTNGEHWWFKIPEEDRVELHGIREELGLGRPFFGLHMTIGHPNEIYLVHSQYIHDLLRNSFTD